MMSAGEDSSVASYSRLVARQQQSALYRCSKLTELSLAVWNYRDRFVFEEIFRSTKIDNSVPIRNED